MADAVQGAHNYAFGAGTRDVGGQFSSGVLGPPYYPTQISSGSTTVTIPSQTPHACDSCRRAKSKCSGDQPCVRCQNFGKKQCIYGDGKRDKERKERNRETRHHDLTRRRNEDLEDALRRLSISPNLDASEKNSIQEILNKPPSADESDENSSRKRTSGWRTSEHLRRAQLIWDVSSSSHTLLTEPLDEISYDVTCDDPSSISGFLGQASEITWIKQVQKNANQVSVNAMNTGHSMRANSMAEKRDQTASLSMATPDESQISRFAWPTPVVALTFLTSYFDRVHPAFPVVLKSNFMATFDQFAGCDIEDLLLTHGCWLGQIHLVFAIGAKFAYLCDSDHVVNEFDHLQFCARAQSLALEYERSSDRSNLHQLTYNSLLCLYFLADNQINSAWDVIGSSVRHAMTLGLHLRNAEDSVAELDKDFRVKLWWSLYSLECLLGEYTGRPSCISNDDISAPLPINRDEAEVRLGFLAEETRYVLTALDSPTQIHRDPSRSRKGHLPPLNLSVGEARSSFTTSTYFIRRTLLSLITHGVLARLYCAAAANLIWHEIQDLIRDFDLELISWLQNLPSELDIQTESSEHKLERASLRMQYHSTRMILYRSYLTHAESRTDPDSRVSEGFSRTALIKCIDSARGLILYLPDLPKPAEMYTKTPWWSLLHYLSQAASVLMLEMAIRAEHPQNGANKTLKDGMKVVLLLRAISVYSASAYKCWETFDNLLRHLAPRIGGDANNMSEEVPPYTYRLNDLLEQPYQRGKNEVETQSSSIIPQHGAEGYPDTAWAGQNDLRILDPILSTINSTSEFPPPE